MVKNTACLHSRDFTSGRAPPSIGGKLVDGHKDSPIRSFPLTLCIVFWPGNPLLILPICLFNL